MTAAGRVAVGVDGWRGGWVAVAVNVDDGAFAGATCLRRFDAVFSTFPAAAVVGVDMPIGMVGSGPRRCDLAARTFVGARRSSVFLMPPAGVMAAASYRDALEVARALAVPGISRQAWALRDKVAEVAAVVAAGANPAPVHEVFPEAAFCAMSGAPLPWSKRTWSGLETRRSLLAANGVVFDVDRVGDAGRAAPDDVYDAAAVAWSARRIVRGDAMQLPQDAEPGEPTIWY